MALSKRPTPSLGPSAGQPPAPSRAPKGQVPASHSPVTQANSPEDADVPREDLTAVRPEHLTQLHVLHDLLRSLNDTLVGAAIVAEHAEKFLPLSARIARQFVMRFPNRDIPPLTEQIAALGNRELETVLLSLLEDLTILNSELQPVSIR